VESIQFCRGQKVPSDSKWNCIHKFSLAASMECIKNPRQQLNSVFKFYIYQHIWVATGLDKNWPWRTIGYHSIFLRSKNLMWDMSTKKCLNPVSRC
jgi:hypothetical protein